MSSYQIPKGSAEWQAFRDYYAFRQEFYSVDRENPEQFWDACLKRAYEIHSKYRSRYVTDLLNAHINDLLRRAGNS